MLNRSGESALASVLSAHQLRATITDDATYCGRWRDREPETAHATFHLMASGQCQIEADILDQKMQLSSGDLIIFTRGSAHTLCNIGFADGRPGSEDTVMLCGELDFATGTRNPVLEALPDCVIVRGADTEAPFGQLARLMCGVSRAPEFGRQIVLDKLADALFVMAVRHHLTRTPDQHGLLAALLDAKLALALDALHSRLGEDWTVERLAQAANMSRTAFALRFAEVIGTSPHQYLTEARMTEALRLLKDPRLSTAIISERLGYQSEAAFRRSFKRVHGQGPGVYRKAPAVGQGS